MFLDLKNDSLESMIFPIFSMHSNTWALWKTMDEKVTIIIIVAPVSPMHTVYSVKPLATQKMYTNSELMRNPNRQNTNNTLMLNAYFWPHCCAEVMPKIAYCFWILRNIFISFALDSRKYFFSPNVRIFNIKFIQ